MNTNQSNLLSKLHYQRVCRVAEILGPGTLLVALRTGQPRLPTLAESKSEEHQLDLAESDTGVALGPDSGGLCALVLQDRKVLEVFLAANPALRGVLCVEHEKGIVIFLRVAGSMPKSRKDAGFAWLADGEILTVLVRAKTGYQAFPPGMPPAAPARISLESIDWRSLGDFGLELLRDVLELAHGNRFSNSVAMRGRLNVNFWADFLSRVLSLRFHARRKQFQEQEALTGSWADHSRLVVSNLAGDWVWNLTGKWGQPYRASPAELRHIVARLQVLVARDVPEEREFFRDCVAHIVKRSPGSTVTNAEIFAAITRRHHEHGRPIPSATLAGRWINEEMKEQFCAPKHRNLLRGTHWKRGFHGFALRENLRSQSV